LGEKHLPSNKQRARISMKRGPPLQVNTKLGSKNGSDQRSPLSPVELYKEMCRTPSYLKNNPIAYKPSERTISILKISERSEKRTKSNSNNIDCAESLNKLSMNYRYTIDTATLLAYMQDTQATLRQQSEKRRAVQRPATAPTIRPSTSLSMTKGVIPYYALTARYLKQPSTASSCRSDRSARRSSLIEKAGPTKHDYRTKNVSERSSLTQNAKKIGSTIGARKSPGSAWTGSPTKKKGSRPPSTVPSPIELPSVLSPTELPLPPIPVESFTAAEEPSVKRPLSVKINSSTSKSSSRTSSVCSPNKFVAFGSTITPKSPMKVKSPVKPRSPEFVARSKQEKEDSLSRAEEIIKQMERASAELLEASKTVIPEPKPLIDQEDDEIEAKGPEYDRDHEMYNLRKFTLRSIAKQVATQIRVVRLFDGSRDL
jgi:hypothetical protein